MLQIAVAVFDLVAGDEIEPQSLGSGLCEVPRGVVAVEEGLRSDAPERSMFPGRFCRVGRPV